MLCSQGCVATQGPDAAFEATASAKTISGVCFSSRTQESALGRSQRKEEGGYANELWENGLMSRKETALSGEE